MMSFVFLTSENAIAGKIMKRFISIRDLKYLIKMKTGIKVGDIMTRNFVSAKPDTNLIDCAKEMVKGRVGSLIIKEGQKLVGVLTERDILWAMIKKPKEGLEDVRAKDIATKKIVAVKPSAD